MITEPYLYDGQMIIEQVCPIVINGKFRGIAGVDRSLKQLETRLLSINNGIQTDSFLISSGKQIPSFDRTPAFIAATTDTVQADEGSAAGLLRTTPVDASVYRTIFHAFCVVPGKRRCSHSILCWTRNACTRPFRSSQATGRSSFVSESQSCARSPRDCDIN